MVEEYQCQRNGPAVNQSGPAFQYIGGEPPCFNGAAPHMPVDHALSASSHQLPKTTSVNTAISASAGLMHGAMQPSMTSVMSRVMPPVNTVDSSESAMTLVSQATASSRHTTALHSNELASAPDMKLQTPSSLMMTATKPTSIISSSVSQAVHTVEQANFMARGMPQPISMPQIPRHPVSFPPSMTTNCLGPTTLTAAGRLAHPASAANNLAGKGMITPPNGMGQSISVANRLTHPATGSIRAQSVAAAGASQFNCSQQVTPVACQQAKPMLPLQSSPFPLSQPRGSAPSSSVPSDIQSSAVGGYCTRMQLSHTPVNSTVPVSFNVVQSQSAVWLSSQSAAVAGTTAVSVSASNLPPPSVPVAVSCKTPDVTSDVKDATGAKSGAETAPVAYSTSSGRESLGMLLGSGNTDDLTRTVKTELKCEVDEQSMGTAGSLPHASTQLKMELKKEDGASTASEGMLMLKQEVMSEDEHDTTNNVGLVEVKDAAEKGSGKVDDSSAATSAGDKVSPATEGEKAEVVSKKKIEKKGRAYLISAS
jgi:hypothetical protein